MPKAHVLVSGAGIAGTVLAYWLARHDIKATVIERSPKLRNAGQSLEIAGPSLEVVKKMGKILQQFRDRGTHEEGLAFVDEDNKPYAKLPMSGEVVTFTNEYEILRGDMVDIFYQASLDVGGDSVEYIFGDHIVSVDKQSEKDHKVKVHLEKGGVQEFDLLVVADGMNSKTRSLVFPPENSVFRPMGPCCSFFSIPWTESDGAWSRFYSKAGRQVLLRPHGPTGTAAHLGVHHSKTAGYLSLSDKERKEMWHQFFADVGWEAPRVLQGMDAAEDFYMVDVSQVRSKTYHSGRVVLLGDSAFCPSPFAGVGATLATVGAYVLAGELAATVGRGTGDLSAGQQYLLPHPEEALKSYEAMMRPWVDKVQDIPLAVPRMACPETTRGVRIFRFIMRIALSPRVLPILRKIAGWMESGDEVFKVPDYGFKDTME